MTIDKEFYASWRESKFPGGCAHAGELETSMYLYLDEDNVRKEKVQDGDIEYNNQHSDFHWTDLLAAGPAPVTSWTASYTDSGVLGEATLATKEKGEKALRETGRQLARWIEEFGSTPKPPRGDHHAAEPTMAMPWQQPETPTDMGNVHGDGQPDGS